MSIKDSEKAGQDGGGRVAAEVGAAQEGRAQGGPAPLQGPACRAPPSRHRLKWRPAFRFGHPSPPPPLSSQNNLKFKNELNIGLSLDSGNLGLPTKSTNTLLEIVVEEVMTKGLD